MLICVKALRTGVAKIEEMRILVSGLLFTIATTAAEFTNLFNFEQTAASGIVATANATAQLLRAPRGGAVRVETIASEAWPGVTLRAPNGPWDLSPFANVSVRVRNLSERALTINCRVDNDGADGVNHCVTGSTIISPHGEGIVKVALIRYRDEIFDGKLFGMRGYPKTIAGERTIDASRVTQILLFVAKPTSNHAWEIESVRAEGSFVPPTARDVKANAILPLIDTFGQYRHQSWPGKVLSLEDLKSRARAESQELRENCGPTGWDQFGGWADGPQLKATGFFRVEKREGKWWLVDPAGRLFWSHGIDCVRMLDATPIEERETWFEDFPGAQSQFEEFSSRGFALKGHYAGRNVQTFSFAGVNLQRKYGPDWRVTFNDVAHKRLRSWGLNTIGNWSDEGVRLQKKTPYVDAIGSGKARKIEGSDGYWGKFPDVFDSSFRQGLRQTMLNKRGTSAGDPWCIGFFSDNEIAWGDEISLALAALQSPSGQPAKQTFIADLKSKYADIAKLNHQWGSSHASWERLSEGRIKPETKKAREDLEAFYSKLAEQYFRVIREEIKETAPNQLYLGCRFARVNSRAAAAAAKYCDVVSYNLYRHSVADFEFNGGADVPLIIGEFHFGALDRGMFHTGLVPTASQNDRAEAYANYVTGALQHPQFVGCHWFQYQDEPTTGRVYDEENYQIGFVDIADTPYPETVAASRRVAANMYETRSQKGGPRRP